MSYYLQLFIAFCLLATVTRIFKFSIFGFLLLVSVPIIYFYPFSVLNLFFSLLLALTLKNLLVRKNNLNLILFATVLIVSLFVSGHLFYSDMAIANVTNSQRGEHPNFQTNLVAKILHNRTTTVIYYLQNLNDRLAISTIFASGSYPNLSKYLPIGFLFPWYLFGFIIALKKKYVEYLRYGFLVPLSIILVLTGIFTRVSAEIFIFSLVWFVCFESVEQIQKTAKVPGFFLLLLNMTYLGIFFLSSKFFLNN